MALDIIGVVKVVAFVIAGLVILYVIGRFLAIFASYTKTTIYVRVMKATRRLSYIAILLAGIYYLAIPSLEIPYSSEVSVGLHIVLLELVTVISARVLAIILDEALEKVGVHYERRTLTTNIVKIVVLALGSIGILSHYLEVGLHFAVSLGIIGFAFTFSLQDSLVNLIGWVYIMTSKVFKVGDLVRIGEYRGTILSIGHHATKIVDIDDFREPSGRILTIPNSTALTANILSWVNPPILRDSISFTLTYESDLKRVREIMLNTVESVFEDRKLSSTPKDFESFYKEVGFAEGLSSEPHVLFEPVGGGWVNANLLYLVPFKDSLTIKTLITEGILEAFNAEPDRVKFPMGRSR